MSQYIAKDKKTLFASYVWGSDYIDNFCSLVLPSHLAINNVPVIAQNAHAEYLIITRSQDLELWRKKKVIHHLNKLCKTCFMTVDGISDGVPYSLVSYMQWLSMVYAHTQDFDFIFPLYADAICSKNSMMNAQTKLEEGYHAVLTLGLLTIKEKLETRLQKFMTNNALEIGSRNMVDAVLESVHPFHKAMFLSEEKFTKNPSFFVAEASDGSYQAHTFHHHPFAMRVPEMHKLCAPFNGTLDQHFLPFVFDDPYSLYIAQDSDEVFICSFDDARESQFRLSGGLNRASISSIATFAELASTPMQRHLFASPITLRGNTLNQRKTMKKDINPQIIVEAVLRQLSTPDSVLRESNAAAYRYRKIANANLKGSHRHFLKRAMWRASNNSEKIAIQSVSGDTVDDFCLYKIVEKLQKFNRYMLFRIIILRLISNFFKPDSRFIERLVWINRKIQSQRSNKTSTKTSTKTSPQSDNDLKNYINKVPTVSLIRVFLGL